MSDFVDNLEAVFSEFGAIQARRMFGGFGIYHDGLMFALVADDELYLKADKQSADDFLSIGLDAFQYDKQGKLIQMSYYRAPEAIFDDPDVAKEWAIKAYDAALRNRK